MSLDNANKEERAWMQAITDMGCCVCYKLGYRGTPAVPHHITSGSRRTSHLDTIPLCDPGHHQNGDGKRKISRHPNKAQFEAKYGTEEELLEYTRKIVALEYEIAFGWKHPQ